jgi:hypothetical protein
VVTNINYLNDNERKSKLDNLLLSYNFSGTVNFPTRIHNKCITAKDNIFIDKVKYENYSMVNGLSDHDAQIVTFSNITVDKRIGKTRSIREFNKLSISQFAVNFSCENWENVFIKEDVDTVFNNFCNILENFQLQLPITENIQYT